MQLSTNFILVFVRRMFVGTWNVGGKTPHDGVSVNEWLKTKEQADIYVLGYVYIYPQFCQTPHT